MGIEFKKAGLDMFEESVKVIRNSFITVADDFKLTRENAPTNPAFIEIDSLEKMLDKDVEMFAVIYEGKQIGFVAVENAGNGVYYMERLAILPEYRHNGYGKMVMDFVAEHVRSGNGKKISIGVINENTVLKNWYINYGFLEKEIKVFNHLPFTVCIMEKAV